MTTSSDGYLTATADPATASITLSTDFSAIVPAPTVNMLFNPSDEVAVGMFAEAGTTVARSTAQKWIGLASAALTCTSAGTIGANCGAGTAGQPVLPGVAYTASVYVRANTTARSATLLIDWYTAAGAYVSSSVGTASNDSTTWGRRTASGTAPATARFATIKVTFASAAVAEIHYVDARQLERGSVATAYCDGSLADSNWSGTANNSPSYRKSYDYVTISRADGTRILGADVVLAPGGVINKVYDGDAPRGTAVVYTASVSNRTAAITSTTATATITGQDTVTWLKSLRWPALSVKLEIRDPPDWSSGIDLAPLYPLGSPFPVVGYGTRRARRGTMTVSTGTRAELDALEALVATDGPFLIQFALNSEEPDRYVAIDEVTVAWDVPVASTKDRTVTLPLIATARPATLGSKVSYPGHTYADSRIAWPTYANRTSTGTSYAAR